MKGEQEQQIFTTLSFKSLQRDSKHIVLFLLTRKKVQWQKKSVVAIYAEAFELLGMYIMQ